MDGSRRLSGREDEGGERGLGRRCIVRVCLRGPGPHNSPITGPARCLHGTAGHPSGVLCPSGVGPGLMRIVANNPIRSAGAASQEVIHGPGPRKHTQTDTQPDLEPDPALQTPTDPCLKREFFKILFKIRPPQRFFFFKILIKI